MADPRLKAAFAARRFVVAPGIFDMISAKVADGMGFECLYVTGFGTVPRISASPMPALPPTATWSLASAPWHAGAGRR